VVGKAGTGKTYALGVARHAWQLDGYRVLGAAPTGIATVCLDAEGFEHSRTVDALLGELDQEHTSRGRRRLPGRQPKLSRNRPLHKVAGHLYGAASRCDPQPGSWGVVRQRGHRSAAAAENRKVGGSIPSLPIGNAQLTGPCAEPVPPDDPRIGASLGHALSRPRFEPQRKTRWRDLPVSG